MKKLIMFGLLLGISFTVFPCSGDYFACGAVDVAQVIQSGIDNCSSGEFTVIDVCDNHRNYVITIAEI